MSTAACPCVSLGSIVVAGGRGFFVVAHGSISIGIIVGWMVIVVVVILVVVVVIVALVVIGWWPFR